MATIDVIIRKHGGYYMPSSGRAISPLDWTTGKTIRIAGRLTC
jgi:hypothetical protein